MYDFPTNPPPGTARSTPDGATRIWDGVKWEAALGAVPPSDLSLYTVVARGSTTARALTDRFADRYSVEDWLTPGQPDGTTDNTAQLQAALDAAAGVVAGNRAGAPGAASLMFPAAAYPYIIGPSASLFIPSNSHIIIEPGAILKLGPLTNGYMLLLVDNGTGILIELYGTLDGNASAQLFKPNPNFPATSPNPTTISGGITTQRRFPITVAGVANPVNIGGGINSHCAVVGDRNGLITNFMNWPVSPTAATNLEISGISMTNSAFYSGSAQIVSFGYGNPALITGGTYVAATGIVTLTTGTIAHGIVPGEEIITFHLTGTVGSWGQATGKVFIALPGTGGTTVVFSTSGGGSDGVITGGQIWNWYIPQVTVASGTYVPATGIVTLTTTAPHYLNSDQLITASVTGAAGTIATGVFQVLDGSTGTTLRYFAAKSGNTSTIVGGGSSTYTDATGVVVLTTTAPHGLTVGDTVYVSPSATGFAAAIGHEHVIEVVPSGTQIQYTIAAGINTTQLARVPPAAIISINGGTFYGAPRQTVGSGAVCVSTKSLNTGFDNVYFDNIWDIGPCIYGGGINCYIRNCEVTRCATGPYLFSDLNMGRCVGCELSGNYVHDCGGMGAVNFGPAVALQHNLAHINTRIFNNYITRCNSGIALSQVDGVDCYDNRLYANRVNPLNTYGSSGDVVIGPHADRVRFTGNSIRDPVQTSNSWRGSAVMPIISGTYNNVTGEVALLCSYNLQPNNNATMFGAAYFTVSGTTSSPGGMSVALEGRQVGGAGTGTLGTTTGTFEVHYSVPSGLGVFTITGGTVTPTGFGIAVHQANELYVADNMIGDYQTNRTMLAAIGGQWGGNGVCTGNYYGPCINTTGNFPADMSAGAKRFGNFDLPTGFTDGIGLNQPFAVDVTETYPPLGFSVGYNRSGGAGETNIYLGAGNASGGCSFIKVKGLALASPPTPPGSYASSVVPIALTGNTYTTGTGVTTITTTTAHGVLSGGRFTLSNLVGTGSLTALNATWTATSVTTGATPTITFTGTAGLGTVTITGGGVCNLVVASSGNTYNTVTGSITVTTTIAHGLKIGSFIGLINVTGTVPVLDPVVSVSDFNGGYTVTAVPSSTQITFIGPTDYGAATITGGNIITAVITLSTGTVPHGLVVGSRFTFSLITGRNSITGIAGTPTNIGDFQVIDGAWIATNDNAGTSGTTINYTPTHVVTGLGLVPNAGLDILQITSGAINSSFMDSGQIDTTVGIFTGQSPNDLPGGTLLSLDGFGNLSLGGAIGHGAIQNVATVTSGNTIPVNTNTSFVHVQNAGSIATLTITLPPVTGFYSTGKMLEVNFDNAVGTVTWTGGANTGAPTSIATAHTSINFILPVNGSTWVRRIMA